MPAETVTLALNSGSEVSLSDFVLAVSHFHRLLKALSRQCVGKDAPDVRWKIENMAVGSAVVTASAEHPQATVVADEYLKVGRALTNNEPLQYGKHVKGPAEDLRGMLSNGVHEVRFETSKDEAVLRRDAVGQSRAVPLAASLGAVEGVVEVLSSRQGLRFNLYDILFDRAVSCYASAQHAEELRDIWGKRVVVEGRVSRDPEGRPFAVRDIREMRRVPETHPDAWREARGAIAALPDSPSPEEVVRKMRDAL